MPADVAASAAAPSSRRAVGIAAAGAVIGLVAAGTALFTTKATTAPSLSPEDVAVVNQQPILMADYLAQLQTVTGRSLAETTPAERRKTLNDMIREELMVQRSLEIGMAETDPDARAALVAAAEQQTAADAISRQPSDAELRAFYDAHAQAYADEGAMTVVDLLAPDAASAAAAVQALNAGQPLAAVTARERLRPTGRTTGEEFYFAARIHLGDALFAAAAPLADGRAAGPIRAADGVHVLAMVSNRRPRPLPFDAARDRVLSDFHRAAADRLQTGEDAFLRSRADIQVAPAFR